jgi:PIN domain nuclease of toxin-antitoxin system
LRAAVLRPDDPPWVCLAAELERDCPPAPLLERVVAPFGLSLGRAALLGARVAMISTVPVILRTTKQATLACRPRLAAIR